MFDYFDRDYNLHLRLNKTFVIYLTKVLFRRGNEHFYMFTGILIMVKTNSYTSFDILEDAKLLLSITAYFLYGRKDQYDYFPMLWRVDEDGISARSSSCL